MGDISGVTTYRTTIATAVTLAGRRRGVTAPELSEVTGCPPSTARRILAMLADDGVFTATVPVRKGAKRGAWRTTYRLVRRP
jgi:DNA-binding IclR family transcriptional regulator